MYSIRPMEDALLSKLQRILSDVAGSNIGAISGLLCDRTAIHIGYSEYPGPAESLGE